MVRTAVAVRGRAMEYGAEMSKGSNNVEFEKSLILKGWVKDADGNLTHPARSGIGGVGAVVPSVREQPPRPLERTASAKQGGEGSVEKPKGKPSRNDRVGTNRTRAQVMLVAVRQKRLDDDNLAGGFKALRDAIAESLGIDDGDERVEWIYRQQIGPKPHGTIVIITTKKG